MTGNSILLDTNIVIELFKGNLAVTASIETQKSVNIPFAVLGELYLGAYRSSNPKKHIKQVNNFLSKCDVLIADSETANNYALIKTGLLNKGKPIPENDIWIAATAKQHELPLITRDKHFNEIDGISIEYW
ncbi:MAG: type II toxin-antitoxin system VapC family toxin [Sphingobacteriales bacterium]